MGRFLLLILLAPPCLGQTTVALHEVLAYGTRGSHQASLIRFQSQESESLTLKAQAPLATKITGNLSYLDNRQENTGGAFSPKSIEVANLKTGIEKTFSSGTVIGGEFSNSQNNTTYPSSSGFSFSPLSAYSETKTSVFIRQKLLANSFGSSTQAAIDSAKSAVTAKRIKGNQDLENYAFNLIEQYYAVWLIQTNHKAAKDRLQRQKRLLKVTRIKYERGTADKAEVLQLESAVITSEQTLQDIQSEIEDLWRSFVITLNLPPKYLKINPENIRLLPVDKTNDVVTFCEKNSPLVSYNIESLKTQILSANQNISSIRSLAKPDLFLEARMNNNGIDPHTGKSINESIIATNPQWSLALGFQWNLGFVSQRASLLDSINKRSQLETRILQAQDELKIEKINTCSKLKRTRRKRTALHKIIKTQKRRLKLEEQRFEIGQISLINVIQAGNDVTTSEVNLQKAISDHHVSAWKILKISGKLISYVNDSVSRVGLKGKP